jgi:hypothetical protein
MLKQAIYIVTTVVLSLMFNKIVLGLVAWFSQESLSPQTTQPKPNTSYCLSQTFRAVRHTFSTQRYEKEDQCAQRDCRYGHLGFKHLRVCLKYSRISL